MVHVPGLFDVNFYQRLNGSDGETNAGKSVLFVQARARNDEVESTLSVL